MTGIASTLDSARDTAAPTPVAKTQGAMRTLTVVADRKIELLETARPPTPAAGEVQIAIRAVGLNHIDVWGWRGMAFAKRKLPLVVGAEASGEIVAVGPGVDNLKAGDRVLPASPRWRRGFCR